MQEKEYFIVWNETKSEGFITSSEDDAEFARTRFQSGRAVSLLADSMRSIYAGGGDEETELPSQTVTIDIEAAK